MLVVLLLGDLADAGPGALLDVEQQAGPAEALVLVELVVRARAEREGAEQQVERLPDGVGVAVGPEVADPLALAAPHHHRPGPLVVHGDGQERVALVVAQPHVEARLVALDERVLQHQRLDVVADLDPLDGLGRRHHRRRPRRQRGRLHEVVREPRPQGLGLAHVDDAPVPILELVGPRGVGDRAGGRALHHRSEDTETRSQGTRRGGRRGSEAARGARSAFGRRLDLAGVRSAQRPAPRAGDPVGVRTARPAVECAAGSRYLLTVAAVDDRSLELDPTKTSWDSTRRATAVTSTPTRRRTSPSWPSRSLRSFGPWAATRSPAVRPPGRP